MSLYIIRIDLNGTSNNHSNYLQLHVEMQEAHFSRAIPGEQDNAEYFLPTGQYAKQTDDSIRDVLTAAKMVANTVTKNNSVMVIHPAQYLLDGLELTFRSADR